MATGVQSKSASPPIGVGTAVRRHWIVALIAVVVLVDVAVVVGFKRTPRYTATANLTVGLGNLGPPAGLGSAIEGSRSLASIYSRALQSNDVQEGIARRLARRSGSRSGQVSASPIPESPLIRVRAVDTSERQAVELANAAGAALVAYANRQSQSDDAAAALVKRYHRAALRYRQLLSVRRHLAREYEADRSRANRAALERAAAAADTEQLRRDALLTGYYDAVKAVGSSPQLEIVERAAAAQSDRYAKLQILVFAGLLAGAGLGVALALLLAHRGSRQDADR